MNKQAVAELDDGALNEEGEKKSERERKKNRE